MFGILYTNNWGDYSLILASKLKQNNKSSTNINSLFKIHLYVIVPRTFLQA